MKRRFIGGPLDGTVREIQPYLGTEPPGIEHIVSEIPIDHAACWDSASPPVAVTRRVHRYNRRMAAAGLEGTKIQVVYYLHEDSIDQQGSDLFALRWALGRLAPVLEPESRRKPSEAS